LPEIQDQLARLPEVRVACIGDIMLDTFVYGDVERISPEAASPVISVVSEEVMLGGAANVARNIRALGAATIMVGVVGADLHGEAVRSLFAGFGEGCEAVLVPDPARPTTHKSRYVSNRYKSHLLRADRESTRPICGEVEARVIAAALAAVEAADAVILSDYRKGVLTPNLIAAVIEAARSAGKPVVVDPKAEDYRIYRGASVVTPNKFELSRMVGRALPGDAEVTAAAIELIERIGAGAVLAKRSEEGMSLVSAAGEVVHIPTTAVRVVDVSGAGDTVAAALAVMLGLGAELEPAARVANAAAGVVVGKAGTATLSLQELTMAVMPRASRTEQEKILLDWREINRRLDDWRQRNLRIGFTNGCFDLIHPGHIRILSEARAVCDRLVVGLNSDASVRRLKGSARPLQDELSRATVIAALEAVDLVVVFDEDTPQQLIERIRPMALVKGADYRVDQVVGREFVEAHGGKVHLVDLVPNQSSSRLVAKSQAAA
jgi:D-beta-D-heptose 7-phosphate kinase/D-beta-D-heptose 1-phosphate adenosyltransferase